MLHSLNESIFCNHNVCHFSSHCVKLSQSKFWLIRCCLNCRFLSFFIGLVTRKHLPERLTSHRSRLEYNANNADHKVRRCWRWSRWKDLPAHQLHHKQIPLRVRADGVRQLRRHRDDRRRAVYARIIWHSRWWSQPSDRIVYIWIWLTFFLTTRRSGRLRQIKATELSSDGRIFSMLLSSSSELVWECKRKGSKSYISVRSPVYEIIYWRSVFISVGTWDYASLSKNAILASRHTDGSQGWRSINGKISKNQTETHIFRTGRKASQGAQSREIRRMLCIDTGENFLFFMFRTLRHFLRIL